MINLYENIRRQVQELIDIANKSKQTLHVITLFDNPYQCEAATGMIFPAEIKDIEQGFLLSSLIYTAYTDYTEFEKDLRDGRFKNTSIKHLLYSTVQIGTGVERRSYIPSLCHRYKMYNLACDAYLSGLLLNKAHYFLTLSQFSHVENTIVYAGQSTPVNEILSEYVILKPSLECAALGVTKVKNDQFLILEKASMMRKKYKEDIIIQEYIDGYEVSVPVIKGQDDYIAMPPVCVDFEGDILTYDAVDDFKYRFKILPNEDFPYNNLIPELLEHSKSVMRFLNAECLTRIDYRIKNSNDFFIFDIAALPVLASTGTCWQSFKYLFNDNTSMFKAIIGSSLLNCDIY